jgi:hypothetical protein
MNTVKNIFHLVGLFIKGVWTVIEWCVFSYFSTMMIATVIDIVSPTMAWHVAQALFLLIVIFCAFGQLKSSNLTSTLEKQSLAHAGIGLTFYAFLEHNSLGNIYFQQLVLCYALVACMTFVQYDIKHIFRAIIARSSITDGEYRHIIGFVIWGMGFVSIAFTIILNPWWFVGAVVVMVFMLCEPSFARCLHQPSMYRDN